MSGAHRRFALGGLGLGLAILGTVGALLHRTLRPVREIERYVGEIDAAGAATAGNLELQGELSRLAGLGAAIREAAGGEQGEGLSGR